MYEIVKGPDKVNPPYCEIQGIPLLELVLSKFYIYVAFIYMEYIFWGYGNFFVVRFVLYVNSLYGKFIV